MDLRYSASVSEVNKYAVPSLERAMKLFELLADHQDGLSVSEIATELGVPRNSIFRITTTLIDLGYVSKKLDSSKIHLTRKLFTLGYKAISEENIVDVAREEMRALRDELKETVLIGTLLESEGAVLEELAGTHHFNFRVERGARFQLHCAAPGKAILAFLAKAQQASIVDRLDMVEFNENTITSAESLLTELDKVAISGVAYDQSEQIEGCHCVASPVLDQYGHPVAAIWITGPSSRLLVKDFAQIGERVKAAALSISRQLGYQKDLIHRP